MTARYVLQCVAGCCRVLQGVAVSAQHQESEVCCSVLQSVCCSQCVAVSSASQCCVTVCCKDEVRCSKNVNSKRARLSTRAHATHTRICATCRCIGDKRALYSEKRALPLTKVPYLLADELYIQVKESYILVEEPYILGVHARRHTVHTHLCNTQVCWRQKRCIF